MAAPSTRRAVLRGVCLLAASAATPALAGFAPAPRAPEIFVWPAPGSGRLIVAIAFAGGARGRASVDAPSRVRIHASNRTWSIDMPAAPAAVPMLDVHDDRHRIAAGALAAGFGAAPDNRGIVILETDHASAHDGGRLDIWAEIIPRTGSRVRVGGPLMAEIVARTPTLAERYHASSPALDRAAFRHAVSERVGQLALDTVADPTAHGRHLADLMLPDVVAFHPDRPAGFTFASRNGRHPHDNVAAVVSTILEGAPENRPAPAPVPPRLTDAFPYFQFLPATA